MGKIELDHTGSGSGITLSSDGTDLLLDGTAIGGGGGSPDLYAEDYDGTSTKPSVTGTNSVAIGTDATASSILSLALGPIATASGTTKNTAVGYATTATGSFASALGGAANANGQFALALSGGDADGNNATAINRSSSGSSAKAQANGAVAIGGSYSGGIDSFAAVIANNTSSYGATGDNSVAIGSLAKATGTYNVAIGRDALADGAANAFAFGRRADSGGAGSLALGIDSSAAGVNSVALSHSKASGSDSFAGAIGSASGSYGSQHTYSVALGYHATTSADYQIALGSSTTPVKVSGAYTLPTSDGTNGQVLTTDGSGAVTFADAGGGGGSPDLYAANDVSATAPSATGDNSVAIGPSSEANSADATAFGYRSEAKASKAVAIGEGRAGGTSATAISIGTTSTAYGATGVNSIAMGYQAKATGTYSTALSQNSVATGQDGFAIGKGLASGNYSLAAVIANNSTSYGATGSNSIAMGYRAKATGEAAYALGRITSASGDYSTCLGNGSYTTSNATFSVSMASSYVDSPYSLGFGSESQTYSGHDYSIVLGRGAKSRIKGGVHFGGGKCFFAGQNQTGIYILGSDTTDATAEALTTNNSTPSTDNQIVLPNNSVYSFHGTVVARQDSTDGSACAAWEVKGLIRREGSASTTTLVNSAITVIDNTPSWGLALSADTTNGCLKVQATGAASTNIKFLATIYTAELTYN